MSEKGKGAVIDDTVWAHRLRITTLQSVCCSPKRKSRHADLHIIHNLIPTFSATFFFFPFGLFCFQLPLLSPLIKPKGSGDTVLKKTATVEGQPRSGQAARTTRQADMQAVRQACPPACLDCDHWNGKVGDLVKGQAAKPSVAPSFVGLPDCQFL